MDALMDGCMHGGKGLDFCAQFDKQFEVSA